jgi:predicted nucleotidyltransferase
MTVGSVLDAEPRASLTRALETVLRSRAEVKLALLFGSRARGTAGPTSDLDLAVLAPHADLLEIAAALGHATGEVVDVISLADPGVPLLDELLRDGIPVYEWRPGVYAQWRSHTLADLEIDRPWYERMRDAWLERVADKGI